MSVREHLIWFISLVVGYLAMRALLFHRLSTHHEQLWESLGRPRIVIPFDLAKSRRAHQFFGAESLSTGDRSLTRLAIGVRVIVGVALVRAVLFVIDAVRNSGAFLE